MKIIVPLILLACLKLNLTARAQERTKMNGTQYRQGLFKLEGINVSNTSIPWQDLQIYTEDHKLLHKKAPKLNELSLSESEFLIGQKGKIQVVNFWFVGCAPCHIEIPHLNQLYEDYQKDTLVEIISMCRDGAERIIKYYSLESLKDSVIFELANEQKIQYPVIPRAVTEAMRYKVWSYPTTFIIDTNGIIQFVAQGFTINANPEFFYKRFKKAIEEIRLGNAIALAAKNAEED